ncbi:uncharacterized protein LOC128922106 isoform X2 [Zeugodacus cucurbitae]|nr:uncharacterized protein LOC128922106 isoform X2 [Zeugodacus cucurbitae]
MNFEDFITEESESEVECSQAFNPVKVQVFQKRHYDLCAPRDNPTVVPTVSSGGHAELLDKLKAIESRQISDFKFVSENITAIRKVLKENMPEKAEIQAQSKMLRECRVIAAKTQHSISRITGDMEGEEYLELASKLPMSSEEHLSFVEDKLKTKESTDALMRLMVKSKGAKGTVDGIMRGLFADDLMYHYNLEGRFRKKSLLDLKSIGLVFDVFPEKGKNTINGELRRYVALSHNRFKQKKT